MHHKSMWIRAPVRLPVAGLIYFIAIMFPYYVRPLLWAGLGMPHPARLHRLSSDASMHAMHQWGWCCVLSGNRAQQPHLPR